MSDQESTPPLRALPRRVQTVTVIIVLVSIVIGVLLFNRQGGNGFIDPGAPLPKVGEHISFGMYDKDNKAVLTDIQGQPFNINSLAGHPIWINAWASWCPPCKAEMPDLQILYTKERVEHPDLVLLLMNVGDDRISGLHYYQSLGLDSPVVFNDGSRDVGPYRIPNLPTHIFIDHKGIVQKVFEGNINQNNYQEFVRTIL